MSAARNVQNRLTPVLSAIDKLDALLSEIPSEFMSEFEEAAKELIASRSLCPVYSVKLPVV